MTKRILTVLAATAFLLASPATASAWEKTVHRVALPATDEAAIGTWKTGISLPADRILAFKVMRDGREITKSGFTDGLCRFATANRSTIIFVASCGASPLKVHYVSRQPLVLYWWFANS